MRLYCELTCDKVYLVVHTMQDDTTRMYMCVVFWIMFQALTHSNASLTSTIPSVVVTNIHSRYGLVEL